MLIVLHSGQTGVERGAQRGAVAAGLPTAGFCEVGARDELGRLPAPVAERLMPCSERGPRAAIEANLAIATAVMVVVPEAKRVSTYTGMAATLRSARARHLPHTVVDPSTSREDVLAWIRQLPETCGSVRLFVTGPRGTRWAEGERLSWQLVATAAA